MQRKMHRSDLRINTVPVSGLQYSTSPSLPTAVKAVSFGRDNSAAQNSSFPLSSPNPSGCLDPLPRSTLDLYDKFYNSLPGTEPAHHRSSSQNKNNSEGGGTPQTTWSASLTLPEELSGIGPSARRLLQLDEAQRKVETALQQHISPAKYNGEGVDTESIPCGGRLPPPAAAADGSSTWTPSFTAQHVSRTQFLPATARTMPIPSGKMKSTSSSSHARGAKTVHPTTTTTTAGALPTAGNATLTSAQLSLKHKTLPATPTPLDVRPPLLSSTITNGGLGGTASNMTRASEAAAPSLVTQLQSYIQRELIRSSCGGGGTSPPSAMDQLCPYREAFRALCSAFPAYASLLADIQSAYDNVIQAQAELLTDAYGTMTVRDVERSVNRELVTTLNSQVTDLQAELKKMHAALETRVLAEEQERQKSSHRRPLSAQLSDIIELRRELGVAHQRIHDLERSSQGDLEKIVVLIGAVRECDGRLKEYERIVAGVTGQVSELDEFKRIAGEAQAELQLFRKKYADYVSVTDFQLMKDYLAAELEAAQLQTRRWRRTAAVRGTQLDVMQRRLTTMEEERASFVKAAEEVEEGATASPALTFRALLTPRPSWKKLHADLPELAEYVADIGQLTTANDQSDEVAMAAGAGEAAATLAAPLMGARSLPPVTGPRETSLQVEYLVERVRTLEAQLQAQQQRRHPSQQPQPPSKQTAVQIIEEAGSQLRAGSMLSNSIPLMAPDSEGRDRNSASVRPTASAASTTAARSETNTSARRTSRRALRRFSEGFQASAMGAHGGGFIPVLAPPLELPLVGLGYGPEVPVYLRASGIVPRRPVPSSTIVSLVYHFFLDILPPYMDQQDQLRRRDDDAVEGSGGGSGSGDRIATCLYEYLQSEMATREDLKDYDNAAHLMMNLIRDGEGREWFGDALHVLLWTVHGVLPPRIAVDAAVVVAQVKRDVRALNKDLQSSRLRRQALSECLQPVLELKSPSELAELRAALGGETTFSVDTLCSDGHSFMEVLFVQECRASAELYVMFLSALSARATSMGSRATSASTRAVGSARSTAASSSPPPLPLQAGDRVVTLADVAAAILEVEPLTPEVVVRELSVNAATASAKQDLVEGPPSPTASTTASAADGNGPNRPASALEKDSIVVRLSDIVRAIGAAPLIRRTKQNTPENCVL
ncbi:hypothetical protein ABB37_02981 [Leptomonas pyrrhocoris]|uniref:Uncharacterized protein n=1 Tax=Leptomonas pyrrhocoris TaxID=157538 RepID=A0A0N0VGH1_LEPPY|nr:hypothetical protein ABB37_02981 [Leptomonas pyrrhocoris]KPA83321.1 hypothetical protein ABB37_02981 [Leptomonas pyrrhocoris]|eukprot:XP_015661760.1 hypothetical protein ABB37_02981 [Leptomonas pyrrhocoris]